jgi:hypothetical protein
MQARSWHASGGAKAAAALSATTGQASYWLSGAFEMAAIKTILIIVNSSAP